MERTWKRFSELVEAFCNFAFATIVFFMAMLLLAPALKLLEGREGIGWIALTCAVMGALYLAVQVFMEPALDLLDRIRKGESFAWALRPLRNISAVLGIYGVFKLEYFLIHGTGSEISDASWTKLVWEFITKL